MTAMFFMVLEFLGKLGLFLWVGVVLGLFSLLAFNFWIALALHVELFRLLFFYFKAKCFWV